MDIQISPAATKVLRTYKLEPDELAFADLVALGWEPEDAWAVAIRKGLTWTKAARKEALAQMMQKEGVLKRIDDIKGKSKSQAQAIKEAVESNPDLIYERATNKTKKIVELQLRLEQCDDPNEWLKINQQLIDVTRMKQDETKKDDQLIHFFLPERYPIT